LKKRLNKTGIIKNGDQCWPPFCFVGVAGLLHDPDEEID